MTRFLFTLFISLNLLATSVVPASARWIQPDWFEVTEPGVGTNRYAYCFNDPINCIDPSGNSAEQPTAADKAVDAVARAISDFFKSVFPGKDWESRDTITSIPGVDMVPGVSTGIAIAEDEPADAVALELLLEFVGPVLKGARTVTKAMTRTAKVSKKAKLELPSLDRTGKVHGSLPSPKDLKNYTPEELAQLKHELSKSVKSRTEANITFGRDRAHGQRLGAEHDLIRSIGKYLDDL